MTFSFMGNVTSPSIQRNITFTELVHYIQNNPNHYRIQELQSLEYGSSDYKSLKETLPCVKPHATFNGVGRKTNLVSLSGYVYLDIDSCDPVSMKEYIIKQYGDRVCLVSKSVGGGGISFYVRIANPEQLTVKNFSSVQQYLINEVFQGLNIDLNAKGVVRNHILPSDNDVYFNEEVSVDIPDSVYNLSIVYNNKEREYVDTTKRPIFKKKDVVPITECNGHIIWATRFDTKGEKFLIGDFNQIKLFIPPIIPDGQKHLKFKQMVNAIHYNNPLIDYKYIFSFMFYVNERFTGSHKMEYKELNYVVGSEYQRILETGVYYGLKNKKVVTDHTLSKKERQKAGAQGVGKMKIQKSIQIIREGVDSLRRKGIKVTTGTLKVELKGRLGERAIKDHWREVVPKTEKKPATMKNKTILTPLTRKERVVVQIMGDGQKWSKKDLMSVAVVKDLSKYNLYRLRRVA